MRLGDAEPISTSENARQVCREFMRERLGFVDGSIEHSIMHAAPFTASP
jgi:hypothetical protein